MLRRGQRCESSDEGAWVSETASPRGEMPRAAISVADVDARASVPCPIGGEPSGPRRRDASSTARRRAPVEAGRRAPHCEARPRRALPSGSARSAGQAPRGRVRWLRLVFGPARSCGGRAHGPSERDRLCLRTCRSRRPLGAWSRREEQAVTMPTRRQPGSSGRELRLEATREAPARA
jgi:hypothetical protein